MSIYSSVTEQDLYNIRKIAEQQKNQRAETIKNKNVKQTIDSKLAESLSPITEKLEEVNKLTRELGEIIKKTPQTSANIKTILQNSQSQAPAIENITGTQPPRDTLAFMKRSNNFSNYKKDQTGNFFGTEYILNQFVKIQLILLVESMMLLLVFNNLLVKRDLLLNL